MPSLPASQGPGGGASGVPAVVLDTNAVLDWLLFDDPGMRPVADAIAAGTLAWITCPRLRDEWLHTLRKPALVARLGTASLDSERLLQLFDRHARPAPDPPPSDPSMRCRDPSDQVFIDLALAHRAKWLLTHDRALQALRRRAALRGVAILQPALWQPEASASHPRAPA